MVGLLFIEDALLYSLKVSFLLFHPHWFIASPIVQTVLNVKEWIASSAPQHLLNDEWTSNSFRTCKYFLIIFTYLIKFNHGQLPLFFIVYIQIICIGLHGFTTFFVFSIWLYINFVNTCSDFISKCKGR